MTLRNIIILIALACGFMWYNKEGPATYGPGIVAPSSPVQRDFSAPPSFTFDRYSITELASFDIEARVLGRENYSSDRGAELSPMDLALGWGRMSDESVLADINIRQSGRFYFWRVDAFPIPRQEIETHSANMHLIPANDDVARDMDEIREGDVVQLSGSLVQATSKDGWVWRSSLTRNDTGNGACELIWVEHVDIVRR
ncbi:hypothetical protein [Neptunomonas marina]|uniref:hypothetical protein n=1 Tax=Neptunomonas marina TaxID=1815562 RepID=UPI001F0BBC07|nr:hypothetical protein [Neptunomonas marina]